MKHIVPAQLVWERRAVTELPSHGSASAACFHVGRTSRRLPTPAHPRHSRRGGEARFWTSLAEAAPGTLGGSCLRPASAEGQAGVGHVACVTLSGSAWHGPSERRAARPHSLLLSRQPGVRRAEKAARAGWLVADSHTRETSGFCARVSSTSTHSPSWLCGKGKLSALFQGGP